MRLWYYKMGCLHFMQIGRVRVHRPPSWRWELNQLMPTPPTWHNHPFFTAN